MSKTSLASENQRSWNRYSLSCYLLTDYILGSKEFLCYMVMHDLKEAWLAWKRPSLSQNPCSPCRKETSWSCPFWDALHLMSLLKDLSYEHLSVVRGFAVREENLPGSQEQPHLYVWELPCWNCSGSSSTESCPLWWLVLDRPSVVQVPLLWEGFLWRKSSSDFPKSILAVSRMTNLNIPPSFLIITQIVKFQPAIFVPADREERRSLLK